MQKTIEFLQNKEFVPYIFQLNWQHISLLAPKVANIIDLRYKRLFLYAKIKFHANQLKIKIVHLKILILQGCQCINKMKQELKYILSLKIA